MCSNPPAHVTRMRSIIAMMLGVACLGGAGRSALAQSAEPASAPGEPSANGTVPSNRENAHRAATRASLERHRDAVRAALKDASASAETKREMIYNAYNFRVRDLQPTIERLAKEDPSPNVRQAASRVLGMWKKADAETARQSAAEEEIRTRATMTPAERKKARQRRTQAEEAREREYFTQRREELLDKLRHAPLKQRRVIASSGSTWAKYVPESLPVFRDILIGETDRQLRASALRVLAKYDGEGALTAFTSCLAPPNHESLRMAAAYVLASRGRKEGIPVLIEVLRTTESATRRYQANASLARITRRNFGFPFPNPLRSIQRPMQEQLGAQEQTITAWEAWWNRHGSTFVLPAAERTSSNPSNNRRQLP